MNLLRKMLIRSKCKIGLHDPRVYGYTTKSEKVDELYYTCLYCPYGFWDYIVDPPKTDLHDLSEYNLHIHKESFTK